MAQRAPPLPAVLNNEFEGEGDIYCFDLSVRRLIVGNVYLISTVTGNLILNKIRYRDSSTDEIMSQ
jgi:hypothetical protein